MNVLREVLSLHVRVSATNRLWLLGAAIAAVILLSFYVSLLHEQVARGEQMRQVWHGASDPAVTRVAALPTSLMATQRQRVSAGADDRSR